MERLRKGNFSCHVHETQKATKKSLIPKWESIKYIIHRSELFDKKKIGMILNFWFRILFSISKLDSWILFNFNWKEFLDIKFLFSLS